MAKKKGGLGNKGVEVLLSSSKSEKAVSSAHHRLRLTYRRLKSVHISQEQILMKKTSSH